MDVCVNVPTGGDASDQKCKRTRSWVGTEMRADAAMTSDMSLILFQ